jgi:hypothetical protein
MEMYQPVIWVRMIFLWFGIYWDALDRPDRDEDNIGQDRLEKRVLLFCISSFSAKRLMLSLGIARDLIGFESILAPQSELSRSVCFFRDFGQIEELPIESRSLIFLTEISKHQCSVVCSHGRRVTQCQIVDGRPINCCNPSQTVPLAGHKNRGITSNLLKTSCTRAKKIHSIALDLTNQI